MSKPKLLWISDAAVETGFARVTHNILGWLGSKWDRHVLGLNTTGDPHPYPYPIYPSRVGGDFWGFGRFPELVKKIRPDVIVIQSDGWIVESFVEVSEATDPESGELIVPDCPPIVGFMPIDARGMKRSVAASLSKLALSMFYTEFARQEAISCGHNGASISQGLGVRREIYKPASKAEARKRLLPDLPRNAFVVGNVNRNQPRKRLDLTIAFFAEWQKRSGADAYLYLHCLERDSGFDLRELAHWYGIGERLFMPTAKDYTELLPESAMPLVYSALDVQVSTSLGEGFGLCTLEGMACGVPQGVPGFAALGEWPRGAVYHVPVTVQEANFGFQAFGIGGTPQKEPFIEMLDTLYRNPNERRALSEAGLALAAESRFEWSQVAKRFDEELSALLGDRKKAAA